MEYLIVGVGRARLLVIDPHASPNAKPVGYGNLIRHVQQGFEAAHGLGARLCLLPAPHPLNSALLRLTSPDVRTVEPGSWAAMLWRLAWLLAAPFRHGQPGRWPLRLVAGAVRSVARAVRTRARQPSTPAPIRACAKSADRAEKWARRVEEQFVTHTNRRWTAAFKQAGRASRERLRPRGLDGVRVTLPEALQREGATQAGRLGIRPEAAIVCLHLRESGSRSGGSAAGRELDGRRNVSPDRYGPALDWLTAAGYTVVRIGRGAATPLACHGVVDLATSPGRTDLLEIWCLLRSRFFIACDSGPYFLSRLMRIPCLAVNVLQVCYHIARPMDRFICKRAVDRRSGRALSIEEMLSDEYLRSGLDPGSFDHVENTADDLREAVEDMVAVVNGDLGRSAAQRAYDRTVELVVGRWQPSWSGPSALSIRRGGLGTISRPFAERYLQSGSIPETRYGEALGAR